MSFVNICEKIDRVITTPHCITNLNVSDGTLIRQVLGLRKYCDEPMCICHFCHEVKDTLRAFLNFRRKRNEK